MKHFYVSCFLFFLCSTIADAQNYMNIPGPENVLVVYKAPVVNDSVSYKVMEYYKTARGIPEANIVGLDDLTEESYSCAELENFT